MKLSVIIPCFNAADTIVVQLEAVATQRWLEPWEVIVSDNGSSDGSLAIVEQYKGRLPNLRTVDSSDRRGPAHAKNIGARAAAGDALVFCDADDEVAPGWIAAIGEALSLHEFVASRFDFEKLNPGSGLLARGTPQRDGLQIYHYPPYLPHAGGCGLGVKRTLHEAIGGFDEAWPVLEDTDYCFRIQLTGVKLHFVSNALVHIRYRPTSAARFRQARAWGEYNVLLYKKYRLPGMPKLSWKDGLSAWIGLLGSMARIRSRSRLQRWLWRFGWRIGRLQGCIKHKIVAL